MRHDIEYQVILFPIRSEVFPSVINDMVCSQRAHKVQLAGVIHPGYLSLIQFGKLHCERTGTTTGTIDQTFCPGWTCPLSRIPCRAITAACGMAAASSNVILAGFSAKAPSRAQTYSAKPPRRGMMSPKTSSPG